MVINPVIEAQAEAFVNARRAGKRARVPAIRFEFWQQFWAVVYDLGAV
ncbi:succinate dehydrogenase flavoprotein subunit [Salmonella enterica]|nr:succinate dehydrogenase flavoprotein subunit [Salmonella enterica]